MHIKNMRESFVSCPRLTVVVACVAVAVAGGVALIVVVGLFLFAF